MYYKANKYIQNSHLFIVPPSSPLIETSEIEPLLNRHRLFICRNAINDCAAIDEEKIQGTRLINLQITRT